MCDDEEVEPAGESYTCNKEAGELKKGDGVVMQSCFPCIISEISISKTGKHGSSKVMITAYDMFTNKKYDDAVPATSSMQCPIVRISEYKILGIDSATRELSLIADSGVALNISTLEEFSGMRDAFESGKVVYVTVTEAMGKSKVDKQFRIVG